MFTRLDEAYHIAIPTAFKREDESVDVINTIKYLIYLKKLGIKSAMISGTTGEQHSMTADEKIDLINEINKHPELASDFELIFGVASIREKEAIKVAKAVNKSDVIKGVLLGFPPYIQPTQKEAYVYAKRLTELCKNKSVIIYNNPEQTGFDIDVESFIKLLTEEENIIGIKETGDWTRVPYLLSLCPRKIYVYAGGEDKLKEKVRMGYTRISSIAGNLYPTEMKKWFERLLINPNENFEYQKEIDEINKHSLYQYLKDYISNKTGIDMGIGRFPIGD